MRGKLIFSLAAVAAWLSPSKRSDNGVLEIHARKGKAATRRDSTFAKLQVSLPEATLNFTGIEYFIDYDIGGQSMVGIMDTGSSDTWVFSSAAGANNYTFDPIQAANSSHYKWLDNTFQAAYGDGSNTISGSWASDTVTVAGASVDNYDFAFANNSSPDYFPDNIAIFGLSVEDAETRTPMYKPFTQRLKEQGTIDSYTYTIFTTNEDSTEATLLLGGIDSAKYEGPLIKLPRSFLGSQLGLLASEYLAVETEADDGSQFQAIWDTGTSQVLVPQTIADNMADIYGFTWDGDLEAYVSHTNDVTGKPPFNLTFSGYTVQIPPEDMILDYEEGYYLFSLGRGLSELGIFNIYILGDALLRQISLTVDLDNNEYAIAKVKHTDESNIQPVKSSIPGAVSPSTSSSASSSSVAKTTEVSVSLPTSGVPTTTVPITTPSTISVSLSMTTAAPTCTCDNETVIEEVIDVLEKTTGSILDVIKGGISIFNVPSLIGSIKDLFSDLEKIPEDIDCISFKAQVKVLQALDELLDITHDIVESIESLGVVSLIQAIKPELTVIVKGLSSNVITLGSGLSLHPCCVVWEEVNTSGEYIAKLNEAIDDMNLLAPIKLPHISGLSIAIEDCSKSSPSAMYTTTAGFTYTL